MSNDHVITITHEASGSVAKVHLFGATVLSYVSGETKEELLWLSKTAKLDGTKAIRGGIPVCFPIFGPPADKSSTMPQHGYARNNWWKHTGTTNQDDMATTASFELLYSRDVDGKTCGDGNAWTKATAEADGTDVKCTLKVRVEAKELTTTLEIENVGKSNFSFQALLHTYYKVDNASSKVQVKGLGGYSILDKVTGASGAVQSYDENVMIPEGKEVDTVYIHPDDHPTVHTTLDIPKIRLEAAGQVAENVSPVSAVVWNPGSAKAAGMGDFDDDGYKNMICVEPGLLGHQPLLQPGAKASLTQSILVDHA